MKVDLAALSLSYAKGLAVLDHILGKSVEHFAGSVPENEMLEWRLAPDMFPLRSQVQFVANLAAQWTARAAGVEVPPSHEGEMDVHELRQAIAQSLAFINSIERSRFEGRDEQELTVDLVEITPTMPIGQWMIGFATTNFYFHLTTAYAILRSHGVPLGKRDLFAGGL